MHKIRIPLESFDLDRFINETLSFLENKVNYPTSAITWVEAPGRCPNDESDESWDFRSKLLNESVYLFFPFAIPDMEGSFDCADGQSYKDPWDAMQGLDEGEEEPECEDEDDLDEDPFGDDIVGYLIQVENGTITITSAICAICGLCPGSKLHLLPDCGFLELPLVEFVSRFVMQDDQEPTPEEAVQQLCEECQRRSATQKPSDMRQEMKERIKTLFREDAGKGFDVVIRPETQFKDFSVVIETRTEDCIKREYAYSYYDRRKTLRDTYVFARGEVIVEEWEHRQTWGPKSGMNLERAAKLFWDAFQEAKRELESEGIKVEVRIQQKKEEPYDLSWLAP